MKKDFYLVMWAQFFSSLADNALFIAAVALIQELHGPEWMAPMMKWTFALAYVLLAAFVGAIADSFPKGRVMFATNTLKILGCLLIFFYANLDISIAYKTYFICFSYALVGIGAAAYSPAKYGIVTEMLPPFLLVKGNSWIEGLTVVSIILGTMLGGALISPTVSSFIIHHIYFGKIFQTPAEVAILGAALVYLLAAICNLYISKTGTPYPSQQKNPIKLTKTFFDYIKILWKDKLGQISLAVTTLFWGAGATLQLIVIEWGRTHLHYRLDETSILIGATALGTIVGALLAGQLPLRRAIDVLPVGVLMGIVVLIMPLIHTPWSAYLLLILIGGLAGFFVVPMNALLQHRGHVLLSAGHSIAVQNFNEQLNILLMVAAYSLMLWLDLPINTIIVIFGLIVTILMVVLIGWSRYNLVNHPKLYESISH